MTFHIFDAVTHAIVRYGVSIRLRVSAAGETPDLCIFQVNDKKNP